MLSLSLAAAYEVLGLPPDADEKLVRKTRFDLVRAYHPDRSGGHVATANKTLAEVNAAYDVVRLHLDKTAAARAKARREAEAREELAIRRADALRADAARRRAEIAKRAAAKTADAPEPMSRMEVAMAAARAGKASAARSRIGGAAAPETTPAAPRMSLEEALRTEPVRTSDLRDRLAGLVRGRSQTTTQT